MATGELPIAVAGAWPFAEQLADAAGESKRRPHGRRWQFGKIN